MDYRQRIYGRYASHFKDAGPTFDEHAARRWARAYDHYLRHWLPADKSAAIIDVACGAGVLLHMLKERGCTNVTGIDISPEQVALARQVNERILLGDAIAHLQGRPASYDLVTALDVIEHLNKDEVLRFLDACFGALRPGGRLVLKTPNADSPWFGAIRYGDFTHEVCFTPELLGRLMTMSGFVTPEARELEPVPLGLKSAARWLLWAGIRAGCKLWNLAETGAAGSGIFTRVFIISAVKRG